MKRTVALVDELVLDVFDAAGDETHVYDYVLHVDGQLRADAGAPEAGPLGKACGYQHVTDVSRLATSLPWQGEWRNGGDALKISLLGGAEAEVIAGSGPTTTTDKRMAMLVVRRRGQAASFASVIEPRPEVSRVSAATLDESGRAVTVDGAKGRYWLAWDGERPRFRGAFVCVKKAGRMVSLSLVQTQVVATEDLRFECSAPLDATLKLNAAECELDVQRGSGRARLSARLPAAAAVFSLRDGKSAPTRFGRSGQWLAFDVQAGERYRVQVKGRRAPDRQ